MWSTNNTVFSNRSSSERRLVTTVWECFTYIFTKLQFGTRPFHVLPFVNYLELCCRTFPKYWCIESESNDKRKLLH